MSPRVGPGAGFRRVRRGRGFSYLDDTGAVVGDSARRARFEALAIPPAWEDVWIAADADAPVQATGRDAKGRKQYRYHAGWRAQREAEKFARLAEFGAVLPAIRRRRAADLAGPGTSRAAVTAAVVWLLERTLVRVGNEEYVRANGSFGLTTLHGSHVRRRGAELTFSFRGKSGVDHRVVVSDPAVAAVVDACRRLPGEHLFQYRDDSGVHVLRSNDVNDYLRDTTGAPVTAKDFRTWMASTEAGRALAALPVSASPAAARRRCNEVIDAVAARLHNTRAVCRASYVHPEIPRAHLDGTLGERWRSTRASGRVGLTLDERCFLGFLETTPSVARLLAA